MNRPPLSLLVFFHPQSDLGKELAKCLYLSFMDDPGQPGMRIPIRYAPTDETGIPIMPDLEFSERPHGDHIGRWSRGAAM